MPPGRFIGSTLQKQIWETWDIITSNCHDNKQIGTHATNIMANPIAVFRLQFLGSHHQPPDGDHTYFG